MGLSVTDREDIDIITETESERKKRNADHHSDFFTMLGHDHGTYYYLSRGSGQVVALEPCRHNESNLVILAPMSFWESHYAGSNGASWKMVRDSLISRQHAIGIYNPARIRGRGAWWDKDRAVVHVGDRVIVDGKDYPLSMASKYIYEASIPYPISHENPLDAESAYALIDICKMASWDKPINAYYLAGWTALAPIGGALNWRPHVWITAAAESGKAQPHDAAVLTPTGWTTMGLLKVGDRITTPDNKFGRIKSKHPQGIVPVFKFTFSDGRTTRATLGHLWKMRLENEWKLMTTAEMIEIKKHGGRRSERMAVPVSQPLDVVEGNKTILPLHPYVLGVMLGDGHLGGVKGQSHGGINLTSYDDFIVEKTRSLIPKFMGLFDGNVPHRFRFGDLSRYGWKTRELVKNLRILGTRSHNKFIPKQYLEGTIEERYALLQGLMDTDGTIGIKGHSSFCTVSKQLADDFCYLVRSLGGIAYAAEKKTSFTYKGEKKIGRLAYNISVRMADRTKIFSLPRKVARANSEKNEYLYLNVESIVPDGEAESSCITIDHPDQLYITDGFTVTHNSTLVRDVVSRILSGIAIGGQSVTTEPAIRGELNSGSLPVIFDEAESKSKTEKLRMDAVVGLARAASTEGGDPIMKANPDGTVRKTYIRSMFLFSSISYPLTKPEDMRRITPLGITRDGNVERYNRLKALIAEKLTDEFCARFSARSIKMIPTVRKNFRIFAAVLVEKFKSQGLADQYGMLLAGAWSLFSDGVITSERAHKWIDEQDNAGAWTEQKIQHNEDTDEAQCWARLREHVIRAQVKYGSVDRSVAELADAAAGRAQDEVLSERTAQEILGRYGLRGDPDVMVVSVNHAGIAGILKDTPWARNWARTLRRLPGAQDTAGGARFGSVKSRGVEIPYPEEYEERN